MNMTTALDQAVADKKLSAAARQNIDQWLSGKKYAEYHDEITQLIEREEWQTLDDTFWQVIPFGTGGRRGTVGVGSNRINRVTMGESAQGFAEYVAQAIPNAKERGIVIACDTRLTSTEFSEYVATVFAANGFMVYLFESFRATPELSFAVRHLNTAAGVVVSASHNPASDNGFKAYWEDGGQIVPPHDTNIIDIASHVSEIKTTDYQAAVAEGQIKLIGTDVDQAYVKAVVNESLSPERDVSIVYSPLHGTGQASVLPVLKAAGYSNVNTVEAQMTPDGNFPHVANNIPNPELPETAAEAIALAKEQQADFALTTDPDADRLGVLARTDAGEYDFLTGNQIAALIGYHVLSQLQKQGNLAPEQFLVKTIVTTDFIDAMATDFGVACENNILIGFKYVGELIKQREDDGTDTFVFGGEESHGILKGSYARDKDAAVAALLIAEQAAELKKQGKTLAWQLDELFRRYGIYWETLVSIFYEGAAGGTKMQTIMDGLRATPPTELGGLAVTSTIDRLDEQHGMVGDVLIYNLSDDRQTRATIRPSGTEPKIKIYTQTHRDVASDISQEDLATEKEASDQLAKRITDDLIAYTESLA